ncbi:hypothetical protein HPB49_016135 [Dermacentor silvarum]|uniref:Uncharacterized protein n=1 Tax=Dermacentor silvarum TaxID=543639 RepID=A0ACB8DE97_DERSI|nr:hypothetical protein HPB49_016135 [Dermacentor silvarum]
MFFKPVLSVVRSNRVSWLLGRRLATTAVAGFQSKQAVVLKACATKRCRFVQTGPCIVNTRPVTTSSVNFQDLSYEDLQALLQGGNIQLIDVREPAEVAASWQNWKCHQHSMQVALVRCKCIDQHTTT